MFLLIFVLAILLGCIFKGNLSNLSNVNIKGIWFIVISFSIEFIMNMMITKGMLKAGIITFVLDLTMYALIFIFIALNRKNYFILLMGAGFLLNAAAIFSNGGTMPVGVHASEIVHIKNVSREGLYSFVNSSTHFKILCDIIPIHFISSFVVSIGDIAAAVGMLLFIVTSMRSSCTSYSLKKEAD